MAFCGCLLGAGICGLEALVVLTWAGTARAAYIRQYDKVYGARLPAGYLEEFIADTQAKQGDEFFDPLGRKRRARKGRIWAAMNVPQDDPELEGLRSRALHRSTLAVLIGVISVPTFAYLWLFVIGPRVLR